MHSAIISVGSNIGDKQANCQQGIDRLVASGKATLVKASRFYRTSPVDFLDQDWFVNAAVHVETPLDPLALLTTLQTIQAQAGRTKGGVRFGPRDGPGWPTRRQHLRRAARGDGAGVPRLVDHGRRERRLAAVALVGGVEVERVDPDAQPLVGLHGA